MGAINLKSKHFLLGLLCVGVMSLFSPTATAQRPETGVVNEATGEVITDPAAGNCNEYLLTFPAWYRGLLDDKCDVAPPDDAGGLSPFIWKIALNVVEMILNLVGYAAVGYIIYGGYKYMISAGSPDGMVAARKTIMNAVIGLVISIAAVAIVRTITGGIGLGG